MPSPRPMSRSPGAKAQTFDENLTMTSRTPIPQSVTMNPAMIRLRCGCFLASRSAAREEMRIPAVAAVKITPVWIAL